MSSSSCLREKLYHSSITIGNSAIVWGGYEPGLPLVHDSPEKTQFNSTLSKYDYLTSSWSKEKATGSPPNAPLLYSSCALDGNIYYFGGMCKFDECFHNDLYVLKPASNEWDKLPCGGDTPIQKAGSGMIPFKMDGRQGILVTGGYGPTPSNPPLHSQYISHSSDKSLCYTNEMQTVQIYNTPRNWSVPGRIGSSFPPKINFSFNSLSDSRGLMFGGYIIDKDGDEQPTDEIIMISFTWNPSDKVVVIFQKIEKSPLDLVWPESRGDHSGVVVNSVLGNGTKRQHLLVIGGKDNQDIEIPDCYILDVDDLKWKKTLLSEDITERSGHSVTVFSHSYNSVCVLITGGQVGSEAVTSPNTTVTIDLNFSQTDKEWQVDTISKDEGRYEDSPYTRLFFNPELMSNETNDDYQMVNMDVPVPVAPTSKPPPVPQRLAVNVRNAKRKQELKDKQFMICREIQKQVRDITVHYEEKLKTAQGRLDEMKRQFNEKTYVLQVKLEQRQKEMIQLAEQNLAKDRQIMQQAYQLAVNSPLHEQPEKADRMLMERQASSWIVDKSEITISTKKLAKSDNVEIRIAYFRNARVMAKITTKMVDRESHVSEMDLLARIRHPNILQFIGATFNATQLPISIYEYMPKTLYIRLQEEPHMTKLEIIDVCDGVSLALCYLHQWRDKPILHNNVKCGSVLLEPFAVENKSSNGSGLRWRSKLSSPKLPHDTSVHVPHLPPTFPDTCSPADDIYSFGLLVTEMVLNTSYQSGTIARRHFLGRKHTWSAMDSLVAKCLNSDCSCRPTSSQVNEHLRQLK